MLVLHLLLALLGSGGVSAQLKRNDLSTGAASETEFTPARLEDIFNDVFGGDALPNQRPLLVHAGPAADVVFGDNFVPGMLLQDLMRSNAFDLDDLAPVMGPRLGFMGAPMRRPPLRLKRPIFSRQSPQERFQISHEKGHFKLHADVPGYSMVSSKSNASSEDQNPLSVMVVGQTLVLSGTQVDGQVTRSFQRSWQLPDGADLDKIAVNFSPANHTVMVDIPVPEALEQAHSADDLPLRDPLAELEQNLDGSGTMLMFASQMGPALGSAADIEEVLRMLESPMVVQHKEVQPYWRLGAPSDSSKSMLEVVLPKGMVPGQLQHRQLPVHRAANIGQDQSGLPRIVDDAPATHVDLPVDVQSDACERSDWLLRCPIADAKRVRSVSMDTANEL
mmetsp:Transcript_6061/g.13419  ORF Transcript_6061/g.13419 Transcript_6061/m.13419 type:complete len:391 (+) Transcript_6061:57-1229(+)